MPCSASHQPSLRGAACIFRTPSSKLGFGHEKVAANRVPRPKTHRSCTHLVHCEGKQKVQGILETAINSANVDEAYVKGGEFLRAIGMENQAEIARVLDVAMNPNSLFVSFQDPKRARNTNARRLSVEDDMKPIVNFLSDSGLPGDEIIQVIKVHPPVLSYNVEARLKPLVSYLESIGVENPMKALAHRPSLFGLEVGANLKKIVDYLQANDYSREQIVEMLESSI